MDAHTAILIVAASERDANLYYATRFLAPDSFVFMQTATQKILLMSDLEIDRAKQQSTVDVVLSYSVYDKKLKDHGMTEPKAADVIKAVLDEFGLTDLVVPTNFGIEQHAEGAILPRTRHQIAGRSSACPAHHASHGGSDRARRRGDQGR
jgi:hypothetical protein